MCITYLLPLFSTHKSTILLLFSFLFGIQKVPVISLFPQSLTHPFMSHITHNLYPLPTILKTIPITSMLLLFFSRTLHYHNTHPNILGNLNLTNSILALTHPTQQQHCKIFHAVNWHTYPNPFILPYSCIDTIYSIP